jgi:signal transduction histidine kinase
MTAPATALVVLNAAANETLLLDAIRAGAHETLSVATPSAQDLRLTIERALVRAEQPGMRTTSTATVQQAALPPTLPKLVHDLNNAITSINGFADILLTRLPLDEPARTSAEQIRKAGTRAAGLVKSLAPPPASSPSVLTPDPVITARAA